MNDSGRDSIAFLSLRTTHGNLGDALLMRALVREVHRHRRVHVQGTRVPRGFARFVTNDGQWIDRSLGASFWAVVLVASLYSRIRRRPRPVLILTPGHQLLPRSPRSILLNALHLLLLWLLRLSGTRVQRFGFSLSRSDRAIHRALERSLGRLCTHYFVRDRSSLAYAIDLGIYPVGIAPDLSVLLREDFGREMEPIPLSDAPNRPRFAASFRDTTASSDIGRLCTALMRGDEREVTIIDQTGEDTQSTGALLEAAGLSVGKRLHLVVEPRALEHARATYCSNSLVVSNRLHVVLIALLVGVPSVAAVDLEENAKVVDALSYLGLGDRVLAVDRAPSDPCSLWRVSDAERESLASAASALRKVLAVALAN